MVRMNSKGTKMQDTFPNKHRDPEKYLGGDKIQDQTNGKMLQTI